MKVGLQLFQKSHRLWDGTMDRARPAGSWGKGEQGHGAQAPSGQPAAWPPLPGAPFPGMRPLQKHSHLKGTCAHFGPLDAKVSTIPTKSREKGETVTEPSLPSFLFLGKLLAVPVIHRKAVYVLSLRASDGDSSQFQGILTAIKTVIIIKVSIPLAA